MTSKICTKCKESKELTEFHKHKSAKDGVQHYCKICASTNYRDWVKDNTNLEKNKIYNAIYRLKNQKKIKETRAKWTKTEKGKIHTSRHTANRQDRIKQATPPWITKTQLVEIKAFYTMCKEKNKNIKDQKLKLSVNHLIPIVTTDTGTTVGKHIASGLHVPWNMKLVSRSENSKIACSMDPTLYKVL